jgi:hypothetical protein
MKRNHRINARVPLGFFGIQMETGVSGSSEWKMSNKADMATPRQPSDQIGVHPGAPFL